MRVVLATLFAFIVASSTVSVSHAKRVALVIGNDRYENLESLKKAVNDARSMDEVLASIGFETIRVENADYRQMNAKLLAFSSRLRAGDEALFFFAGHGVEIEGRNYLLPTDVPNGSPGQDQLIKSLSVGSDAVLDYIRRKGVRVSVLILDACRNNPFKRSGTRSLGRTRGLARADAPEGTFIMYSAGVGQRALDTLGNDDPHPNSVFTRSLIPLLRTPGLGLAQTARQVRLKVQKLARRVSHDQRPAYYDEVTGNFYFTEQRGGEAPAAKVGSQETAADREWSIVKNSSSCAMLDTFLQAHGQSRFARYARARRKELKCAQTDLALGVFPKEADKPPSCKGVDVALASGGTNCIKPGSGSVFKDCPTCPEMVVVPAGRFMMGATHEFEDKQPVHAVNITKPFAVGKYEITVAAFERFVKATGHKLGSKCNHWHDGSGKSRNGSFRKPGYRQTNQHPATCVSWYDAEAYVLWLARKTGQPYRLLSESEWEYAARAGTQSRFYFGSDDKQLGVYEWYRNNSGRRARRVGAKASTPFGLHDILGNVSEWVADFGHRNYEGAPTDGSPWGKDGTTGKFRILRGGTYVSISLDMEPVDRRFLQARYRGNDTGFRIARTLVP